MNKGKKKLLSTNDLGKLKNWLVKEFGAVELSYRKNEFQFHCPWCDKDKKHSDYTFNIEKQEGHCWRGFSEYCESGHTLLVFVAFYYNTTFKKARSIIRSQFESEDSLQRVKQKLRDASVEKNLAIASDTIVWNVPHGAEWLSRPNTKECKRALAWLKSVRTIPDEVIRLISPRYIGDKVDRRWERHKGRVFFPVQSMDNLAWISYSTSKSKKIPKTLNPPGKILSNMLYLYNFYHDSTEPLILCEGIFDALRLFIFGYNAVALFGTNVSEEQIDLINMLPINEVIVCLDADATRAKKSSKTGKWNSKAYKVARVLKQYFFGTVSVMRIHTLDSDPDSKLDPDMLTYLQAQQLFDDREEFGKLSASLRRLKARYA